MEVGVVWSKPVAVRDHVLFSHWMGLVAPVHKHSFDIHAMISSWVHAHDKSAMPFAVFFATTATGTLPSGWGTLSRLTSLTVSGLPGVSAALPPAWSALTSLVRLNVSGCGVIGPLPEAWGQDVGLSHLTSM
jgi:hypothetical protein